MATDESASLAAIDAEVNRVVLELERGHRRPDIDVVPPRRVLASDAWTENAWELWTRAGMTADKPPLPVALSASPRSTLGPFTAPPDVRIGQELQVNGCPARVARLRYVRGEWQAWVDVDGAPGAPWEVGW